MNKLIVSFKVLFTSEKFRVGCPDLYKFISEVA